jgi:hypothetical protein
MTTFPLSRSLEPTSGAHVADTPEGNWRSYPGSWATLSARLAARGLVNPRLALDLVKTAWAFRRRRWWTRPPFLPLPDRAYLRWRMYTAYASEDAVPPVEDVVSFARWRRETMGL